MRNTIRLIFVLIFFIYQQHLFCQEQNDINKLDKIELIDGSKKTGKVYFTYGNDKKVKYCNENKDCEKYKPNEIKSFTLAPTKGDFKIIEKLKKRDKPSKELLKPHNSNYEIKDFIRKYNILYTESGDSRISRLIYKGKYVDFYYLYLFHVRGHKRYVVITKPNSNEITRFFSDRYSPKKFFEILSENFKGLEKFYDKNKFSSLPYDYEKYGLMMHMFKLTDKSLGYH